MKIPMRHFIINRSHPSAGIMSTPQATASPHHRPPENGRRKSFMRMHNLGLPFAICHLWLSLCRARFIYSFFSMDTTQPTERDT